MHRPPQQLPAFPPLFQPSSSQHHHPSHEPSLFPPLPQAGYGSRWNGGSRSSISSFCSSYHDSSESSLDVSRGEFLRQPPSFGTALPSFQDIDQDHFNHSYDYSPGWGSSSTASRIPGLVQIASSGSSTTTTTTTATPRVPPGFQLGDAGSGGHLEQDWKHSATEHIVPRLWSEPVPEEARPPPQAYQAAPFQQSHEGMIGTSSMDGGGLMATTSSQAIRQLLKPAHAVHNASEALFYRRGSVGPGYRRGSTGPPPLHARSQSLDLTSSDAAPATTSWSTLRLSTTSEATVARVAPEPPILPQAPTLEDFSWCDEEEVVDDEETEFNLVLSRTDSSNSEYGRWHRPVPDTPVGELDPTQVPILSILHAWSKLRTAQGASMVEAWVQRMRLEYQAGNHRVPYSSKLYTMASK
jgi:hypothetical protein